MFTRLIRYTTTKCRNRQSLFTPKTSSIQLKVNLHVYPFLRVKMYVEHENKFAYNMMELRGYAPSLDPPEPNKDSLLIKDQFEELLKSNWSRKSPGELFATFAKFGSYCKNNNMCITNSVFDTFIDNLTDNIKNATDEELGSLFHALLQWPETESIRSRNYIEVWAALDDECLKRINTWTYDEMLSFVSLFYMLNVTRVSDFSIKCLNKLGSRVKSLTTSQIVQAMFFNGIRRKAPFDMHNVEVEIENRFTEFTIDELATISMGFFKSKTPIRSMVLIVKIIDKIIENPKDIHEVALAALLKVIRYSMKTQVDNKIYHLLDVLQHEIPRTSVMCNVHLALLGTATLTLHKPCLNKIANKVLDEMSNTRMKDLERLSLVFGVFNMKPTTREPFFDKLVDELRKPEREAEILKHGRSFASCIAYLAMLEIYPPDLINKVLDRQFLTKTYGKHPLRYGREILTINNVAKIFCKDMVINHLTDKEAIVMAKQYTDFMPSDDYQKQYNASEKLVLDVMRTLKVLRGGEEFVTGGHILTHHQRGDVIICDDCNGTPQPVTEPFLNKYFGLIKEPPDSNRWIALVVVGKNGLMHGSDSTTGPFSTKVRELRKLGYYASVVTWKSFSQLVTEGDKVAYLSNVIKAALECK